MYQDVSEVEMPKQMVNNGTLNDEGLLRAKFVKAEREKFKCTYDFDTDAFAHLTHFASPTRYLQPSK